MFSTNDITTAIERSKSHDEIPTLETADWPAVKAELERLAEENGLECDTVRTGLGEYEAWAYDVDAPEGEHVWRLDIRIATPAEDAVHCECGEATGVPCQWRGPREDTVVVEWMPYDLRDSHVEAGNHGAYPHNGAERLRLEQSCADILCEDDEDWAHVVGGAL